MVENIVSGVVAGLVASGVFFLLLAFTRPRLKISTCITRTETGDADPTHRHRIKIVNRSFRSCVDVEVTAFETRSRKVPREKEGRVGTVVVQRQIDLRRSTRSVIPGFRPFSATAPYAQRIRFDQAPVDSLGSASDQQTRIVVRVTARDGLTGFPRRFEQHYILKTQVRDGTFYYGRSLKVASHP